MSNLLLSGLFLLTSPIALQEEKPLKFDTFITSWQSLEEQLAECWHEDLKRASEFQCAPVLRKAIASRDFLFLQSMIAHSDHPMVGVAGCLGLRELDIEAAGIAAFFVYAESSKPLNVVYQPLEALVSESKPATAELTRKILDECVHRYRSDAPKNLILAFDLLDVSAVKEWLLRGENTRSSLVVARAVDFVLSRKVVITKPETDRKNKILRTLRQIPGDPRMVYVLHANPEDDVNFKTIVINLLENEELDDITILAVVSKRKQFIRENIRIDEIKCDVKRRKFINRILSSRR